MNAVKIGVMTIIAVSIALFALFYTDIKGYEKIERVNEWVLYYCDSCGDEKDLYKGYILMNGFQEITFNEAIERSFFNQEVEDEIIDIIGSEQWRKN